jgi:hypothetical protein
MTESACICVSCVHFCEWACAHVYVCLCMVVCAFIHIACLCAQMCECACVCMGEYACRYMHVSGHTCLPWNAPKDSMERTLLPMAERLWHRRHEDMGCVFSSHSAMMLCRHQCASQCMPTEAHRLTRERVHLLRPSHLHRALGWSQQSPDLPPRPVPTYTFWCKKASPPGLSHLQKMRLFCP